MGKPLRRWIIACTQIVVSMSLIGWIFLNINFQNTLRLLVTANILPLIFCIIALAALVIPAAIRWRWFVARFMPDGMVSPDLGLAIRINAINVALNQFLPSTIGGDLYRVVIAKSLGLSLFRSAGATVADRLSAFVILIVVSGPALIITLASLGGIFLLSQTTIWLVLLGLTGFLPLCWGLIRKHAEKFASAFALFQSFWRANGLMSRVVFSSLIIQFVTLAVMIATAKILDIRIGVFSLFGIMAATLLASRLPISVAGWGVREGVLVSFLSAYGIAAEKAFATSVIYGLTELVAALLALLMSSAMPIFSRFFPTQSSSEHQ
ncbi:flippase-like domain-containing protein [Alphaproteobacteria bacterium]|nr:flippase-like domain-containing protein [Alphaproteobacteria bacterium]